jgi:hypothetical protein
MRVSLKKTVALVCALAKLHNFCIDDADGIDVPSSTALDELRNEMSGAVPLVETPNLDSNRDVAPQQLLDGGYHFDDIGQNGRYNRQRQYEYVSQREGSTLPRDILHSLVSDAGLTRPTIQRRAPWSTRINLTSINI